jgi:hypothetical protein
VLASIIDTAVKFRDSIQHIICSIISTPDDLTNQRFYLRKIEGADVLLVNETNYLRAQLHKWAPVASEPPKGIEVSLSTRKPRPTKVQKLLTSLGVKRIEEVPEHLRPKIPRRRVVNNSSGKGSFPERPSGAAKPGESVEPWRPMARAPAATLGSPSSPRSATTTPGGAFERFEGRGFGEERSEMRRESTGGIRPELALRGSSEREFERRTSAGGERPSGMSPSFLTMQSMARDDRQFQFRSGAGPLASPRLDMYGPRWDEGERFGQERRGSAGRSAPSESSPAAEPRSALDPALASPRMRPQQSPSAHHSRVGSLESAGSARRSAGVYGGYSGMSGNVDPALENLFGPPVLAPAIAGADVPMGVDGQQEDRMMMDERTEDLFGSLTNGAGEGEEYSFAPADGFEERRF